MNINPKDAWQMMKNNKDYYFLDVREVDEHKEGCPKGAVNLPLSTFEETFKKIPSKKIPIVICQAGTRSKKAAKFLIKNGFAEVYNVKGGFIKWKKDKLPVEKTDNR